MTKDGVNTISSPRLTLNTAFEHYCAGRLHLAGESCRSVLAVHPNNAASLNLLGLVTAGQGDLKTALRLMRRSVTLAPSNAGFYSNLGILLGANGNLRDAVAALREAIRLKPGARAAHRNLGMVLGRSARLDEAILAFQEAALIDPQDVQTWIDLVHLCLKVGRTAQGFDAMQKVANLMPENARFNSEVLLGMQYLPDITARQISQETFRWADRFAAPLYPPTGNDYANDRSAGRRLRVGYISGDFREHPIGRFILPVLTSHDPLNIEVYCYSDVKQPCALTARIRAASFRWNDVVELSDDEVAARVRADKIDVLVDITGHMQMQRLLVFARKPAPIQISYLGYPYTSGLRTIDFRITDAFHDPDGQDDLYSERLVRLPRCCWCYQPSGDEPHVADSPVQRNGFITFGCMNRIAKVAPQIATVWSRILKAIPNARLRVLADDGAQIAIVSHLARAGLNPSLIEIVKRGNRLEYLAQFSGVDVHLDTFPYNGHTTTCDGLWMGVPTVSLSGSCHVQRAGRSVLSAVGLQELVADSLAEYEKNAIQLAGDLARLNLLRQTLRARMQASSLMDAIGLARCIEDVFREAWMYWRANASPFVKGE